MNSVNQTLYIPLYGKSFVSKKGLFLKDEKAEEIWEAEGFALKGKSKSKYLAYYMGIRAAVFDEWVKERMQEMPSAAVIHIGCGMDSRCLRVERANRPWYDVDFPEVIAERERYYQQADDYHMIAENAVTCDWAERIPDCKSAIVVMEGVSMYLTQEQLMTLCANLCAHFGEIACLMDCYTLFAAKMSKHRNPINDVGVTDVYGMDDPTALQQGEFTFVAERSMTPQKYIDELRGWEKFVFSKLYAGKFAQKLYRLFEYKKA